MESTRNPTQISIILGRLFLATANACINYTTGVIDISFENKKVKLSIFNATQWPSNGEDCFAIDSIDLIQESVKESSPLLLTKNPLQTCLTHFNIDKFECDNYTREVNTLLDSTNSSTLPPWTIRYVSLPDLAKEHMRPSIESPPQLEMKPLSSTLKYIFFGPKDTLPVIIIACLTSDQESQLIDVHKQHKSATGWSVADLKGISPSIWCIASIMKTTSSHL